MHLAIAHASDIGRRKPRNEDHYGVFGEDTPGLQLFDEGALLCVADGLGGHIAGDIASKLAVSHFKDMVMEPCPEESQDAEEPDANLCALMREWLSKANASIFQQNRDLVTNGKPMGTTLCAALVSPEKVHVINVGDSRCYHIRDGAIIAGTKDHSWVDEQVELGQMSPEEAAADRRRHLVTRCIGTHPDVACDMYLWDVVPGDMLLLCTDGLTNMVPEADICAEIQHGGTVKDTVRRLVDHANERGGRDNITVILAQLSPTTAELIRQHAKTSLRRHGPAVRRAVLILLFGAACFAAGFAARGAWVHE